MKKTIVLILASMLCTASFAQRRPEANITLAQKKHTFHLGVKGGLDFTSMTQPDECDLYDGSGLGFSGGIAGKFRFNQATPNSPAGTGLLGAGFELKYKQNTVKTIGTDEAGEENANLSLGYFEVPVFVQIYPFYKTNSMNNLYIEVGPDFAGTLSRKPESLTVDNVTYLLDKDGSKLKGMDVRLMAGLGYDFAVSNSLIGINARYYLGTSKLAGNFNSKMNTLEVSLSWMFNVGKF